MGAALFLTRAGREHFYGGDFGGAAQLMEAAVSEAGGGLEQDAEAAYRVGQCYWNLRDPRCVQWYRRSIELGVPTKGAHFGLVDGLTWAGEYAQALAALQEIKPVTGQQRATVLAAGAALEFLAHDLGLVQQQRREPTEEQLANADLDSLRESDATSAALWSKLPGTDPRHRFQLARAWFGDGADAWLIAAVAVSHQERRGALVDFLELGLTRSADLGTNGEIWIDAMASAGLPTDALRRALGQAHDRMSSDEPSSWRDRLLAAARGLWGWRP